MSKLPPPSPTHTHTRARARTFFLIVAWCALKLFQRKIKLKDATFYIPDDITAYNDYTNFISEANLAISGRDLLLNIHGQAPTPQRTELGYLISKSQLVDRSYKIASTSTRSVGEYWKNMLTRMVMANAASTSDYTAEEFIFFPIESGFINCFEGHLGCPTHSTSAPLSVLAAGLFSPTITVSFSPV